MHVYVLNLGALKLAANRGKTYRLSLADGTDVDSDVDIEDLPSDSIFVLVPVGEQCNVAVPQLPTLPEGNTLNPELSAGGF